MNSIILLGRATSSIELKQTQAGKSVASFSLAVKRPFTKDTTDFITVCAWDKHQSLDAYEKKKERDRRLQAERRARQKALIQESSDNRLTSGDGQLTVAVSEEEIEEEKEKEEESHSFIPVEDREEAKLKLLGGTLGQNVVLISTEQFNDLCDKLSIAELDKYISIVAECEKNGQHFKKKTHYQAILDMVAKDRRLNR